MKSTLPALFLVAASVLPAVAETTKHDFKGAATAEVYKMRPVTISGFIDSILRTTI